MINITFYGVDPYLLRGLSKDLTQKIANLCEVSKEDVLFMASEGLICNNGIEQDTWYALIKVEMPQQLEVLEKSFYELLKLNLGHITIHFELIFTYYHLHSRYLSLNEEYPRYIDEANQVNVVEEEENLDALWEDENNENESSNNKKEINENDIYLGNAFEGFEEKLKEKK